MKSKVVANPKPTPPPLDYPYVGRSKLGRVVLFTREDTGTVLAETDKCYGLGHWSSEWQESNFKRFPCTIKFE
jgi:hypothetical protein